MATRCLLQSPDAEDQEEALVIRLDVRHAGDGGFCIPEFRMAIRQLVEPGESMMRLEKQRYRIRGCNLCESSVPSPDSRSLVEANRADFRRILKMYLKRIEDPVDLRDECTLPGFVKISVNVCHLRRLGMTSAGIDERLRINLWMAKRAARWSKTR